MGHKQTSTSLPNDARKVPGADIAWPCTLKKLW
jgi:hypothetical protein